MIFSLRMKTVITRLSVLLLLPLLFMQTGCETESAAVNNVRISPESINISKGESIEFTAVGGYVYTWSLEDNDASWGRISTRDGETTVYTSLKDATTNTVVRVLTVSSVIEGSGTASNDTAAVQTGEAYISH
jgi:hypothetical protein